MTPIWVFPAYPLLLVGPIAGYLSTALPAATTSPRLLTTILLAGFTAQGIGFLVSLTIYSAFIYRLMTHKLPREPIRPAMFVSVGPSGFTCDALVLLAAGAAPILSAGTGPGAGPAQDDDGGGSGSGSGSTGALMAGVVQLLGNCAALWVWGLALWFFFVSVGAHWSCVRFTGHHHRGGGGGGGGGASGLEFGMTWFSFVFPNTALVTATLNVGLAFGAEPLQWLGCAMGAVVLVLWGIVFGLMVHAVRKKRVLWPQRQEDRDEGGFSSPKGKAGGAGAGEK
ncbi:MAG: hypothetical protein LQ340_005467, partial [Diploschistes diacapsis]